MSLYWHRNVPSAANFSFFLCENSEDASLIDVKLWCKIPMAIRIFEQNFFYKVIFKLFNLLFLHRYSSIQKNKLQCIMYFIFSLIYRHNRASLTLASHYMDFYLRVFINYGPFFGVYDLIHREIIIRHYNLPKTHKIDRYTRDITSPRHNKHKT